MRSVLVPFATLVIGAAVGVPVTGAATDTTTPLLSSMSIGPGETFNVTGGDAVATLQLRIVDSGSGSASGCVSVHTPDFYPSFTYVTKCFGAANRIAGSAKDGWYNVPITFRRYSHHGFYPIDTLSLRDVTGNVVSYPGFVLYLNGWDSGFNVTGTSDEVAATLAGFSLSPTNGDVADGPITLTATLHVTDDLSGFRSGCVTFGSVAGTHHTLVGSLLRRTGSRVGYCA